MAIKTLDALALAALPERALVQRLATLWCRAFRGRSPASKVEIVEWVKAEFGPVIDAEHREQIALKLINETRRQLRLRQLRKERRAVEDPLTKPLGDPARVHGLLQSRLGPVHLWVSRRRLLVDYYTDASVFSGLVAGIIHVKMRTARIEENPSLLVYRQRGDEARSHWIPGWITEVPDAFIWVIPDAAKDFLGLDDTRVEHDGRAQAVRLITRFGTKTLPWKSLGAHPT